MNSDPVVQLKAATRLCKQGQRKEGLAVVRDLLRRGRLSAEQIDQAGRLIRKEMSSADPVESRPLRVVLLGQYTTSWLATA